MRNSGRSGAPGALSASTAGLAFLAALSFCPGASAEGASAASGPGGHGGFQEVTARLGLDYRLPAAPDGEDPEARYVNREDGGITLADIDGDGRPELYVAHGRAEAGRLFGWNGRRFERRDGNGGIRPAALDRAGYFIDMDADGRPDFVSIHREGVQVFRNTGGGRFTEAASRFGMRRDGSARSMDAADFDSDGDLDLFFARWGNPPNDRRERARYLWRNNGKGRYEDISHIVPVKPATMPDKGWRLEASFTPAFSDIDGDGDPDLLLAGDFSSSQVFRNDGGTAFADITGPAIDDENGMGAAVGDFDGDGDPDWFVTSIYGASGFGSTGNRLYRNPGDGRFADATGAAGVRRGGWGWGACAADFDNDGHLDLFHTNGWSGLYLDEPDGGEREDETFLRDPSRLFMSNSDGTFAERASELGIDHDGQGRGALCADYDDDGRIDLFIANHGAGPTVYRNVFGNGNHWLKIELAGRAENPHGIGARVVVRTASGRQVREMRFAGSYLSQGPPVLHFGLGRDRAAHSVEVRWPGPGRQVSRLADIPANRRLTVRQPAAEGFRLSVVRGTGTGLYAGGTGVRLAAEPPRKGYRFSHWTAEGGGAFLDSRSPRTRFAMPARPATVFAHYLPGPPLSEKGVSVARRWMEVLLQAIRDDLARPPVHARNLFHLSAAMYDAWAACDPAAKPYLPDHGATGCPDAAASVRGAREEAISRAAWRLIRHRFSSSRGFASTARNADALLSALGYGPGPASSAAAVLGERIAEAYIARGLADGSNEANDYASRFYKPVNPALLVEAPGNPVLADPDRWQPIRLPRSVDQSGHVVAGTPGFVAPEWGRVAPFALSEADLAIRERGGDRYFVYHDPGPPPAYRGPSAPHYKWGFALVARWSSQLSPDDGVMLDIAPSGIGNAGPLPRHLEDYPRFYAAGALGPGHDINPATGKPYEPQIVPRGDYTRVLAEFWADGPDSETPPGHWFVILNAVNDHPESARQLGGEGPVLDPLEWDVKAYFALGGAMHDAAIAAWGIKGWYDYIRPVSALRWMAEQGRGDLPLAEGFIEPVGPGDALAGRNGMHVGKLKLLAWRGPKRADDPAADAAGVGWILAENWRPYQRPDFVTPPFAGYVSGHSTFSRAAAEVLTRLTGDPYFPGGMSGFRIPAGDFLAFERGPSVAMTLQWATYRDAADQCSLSRIWGGIHPPADDIPGRFLGARVGEDAFRLAMSHFAGRP